MNVNAVIELKRIARELDLDEAIIVYADSPRGFDLYCNGYEYVTTLGGHDLLAFRFNSEVIACDAD